MITLVFSIPVFCLLIYGWIKKPLNRVDSGKPIIHLGLYFLGVIIGLVPWFSSILQTNLQTVIAENIGSAVAVGNDNYFTSIILHLRNYLLFGITALFGIRPPWGVQILGKPLLVLAIMTWVGIFIFGVKKAKAAIQGEYFYLLLGIVVVFTTGFLFSPFGNDPSGRYFLPLYLVFAILAGLGLISLFRKQIFTVLPVLVLIVFHLWGTMQCANENPPGLTTQFDAVTQINHAYDEQLIKFLQSQNELAGFTNYWVAYPLSFKSDEDLIYIPALPYHQDLRFTERDNRYIPYKQTVLASPKVAYITTNNPVLNDRIRSGFRDIEITWLEKQIGDYHVFYRLSKLVYPQDMELGLME